MEDTYEGVQIARRYVVTVWSDEVLVQDEATPDVHGTILLTEDEREHLSHRLYALEGEDIIAAYTIVLFEDLPVLDHSNILSKSIENYDDETQAAAVEIWMRPFEK